LRTTAAERRTSGEGGRAFCGKDYRMSVFRSIFHVYAVVVASTLAACASGGSTGTNGAIPPGQTSQQQTEVTAARSKPAPSPSASSLPTSSAAGRLGAYRVSPKKMFVAGISSGGFFGVQMHVAHSSVFKGAAIYAGGVYHCAQDSVELALANCGGETVNGQALYLSTLAQSEAYLDQQSTSGTIDPGSNLQGQPIYLWSGTKDSVVNPKEMADLDSEYRHYGAKTTFDSTFPADHGWESPTGEVACGTAASPYMLECNAGTQPYDSEKTWLSLFFGTLKARNTGTLHGSLIKFDQAEFGAGAGNSLDTTGYVFVPKSCASGSTCGFVVAFHGCLQGQAQIGNKFVTESGIDEWADTNGIIVLYPYAVEAPGPTPYNPNGCWDWWGYDDSNYSVKSGTQVSIVYKMVQRVTGAP